MKNPVPMVGSCQCGNIRYQVTGDPLVAIACHCNDCRKLSGSAFSTVLVVKAEDLTVEGTLKLWERATDTGRRSHAFFALIAATGFIIKTLINPTSYAFVPDHWISPKFPNL